MNARTPLTIGVGALCAGLALTTTGPGFAADTSHSTSDRTRATTYAFQGSGYGTRIIGGQLPASSGTTAYQHIGCTDLAGLNRTNDVADATVPGLGTASGVKTRVWTTARHGVVASHARHTIAQLTLASSGLGTLSVNAIRSTAKAFHDGSGFHSSTDTAIGSITFTPPVGPPQNVPAPTPNQPVTVPGLATISLGTSATSHGDHAASAKALALRIDVVPTGTSVKVALSHAQLNDGLTGGIFRGHSNATRVVSALTDLVHSGPNPLSLMGCLGTGGVVRTKSLASLNVGGQLVVSGLASAQKGSQGNGSAHGFERAKIARINLGGGQLIVNAIVGKANVTRTSHGWVRTAKGTQLGSITAGGQTQTFPPSGVLEIPGVAKLERKVVTKTRTGISVVALRITLLDGSGAVINLGEAALRINRPQR
ncbi:choice-of-anchor P family protein [Nocardioides cynanchi]|uniref:choice-of-anchor P family protein n=1 Tax=Nocardioides cynanchi TaxID=2558918 RepID=UPI001245C305|nr:choice-of-anchor P family protein [Nocardioides cynanchi]